MNLRCLLKRDSQRKLLLIESFYQSKNPKSTAELLKMLDCTAPVLASDIRLINTHESHYHIHRDGGYCSLEISDNASLDELYASLIRNSFAFKVLEMVFQEDCMSLDEMAKRLYCSLSAAQTHFKDLESVLKHWKMTIHRRPFRITGDEATVRHLYFLLISEKKMTYEESGLSPELFKAGDALIHSLLKNNGFSCSFAQYCRIHTLFYTSLIRVKHRHRFSQRFLNSTAIDPPDEELCLIFSALLYQELGVVYTEDVMKESFWLLYSDMLLLSREQTQRALTTNFSLAYHYESHMELVDELSLMLVKPLTDEKKHMLTSILINQHLFHVGTKEFVSMLQDRKRDCLALLEYFHANYVLRIRQVVEKFMDEYQCFQGDEFIDNYVYQIIAAIPAFLNGMKKVTKPVNILIIASDSTTQESLLVELIRFSIRGNYKIHRIDFKKLQKKNYQDFFPDYDLVISTSTFDLPDLKTPFIGVELCPSIHSLNKIQSMVDQIEREKNFFPLKKELY
ncbi:hypothetical protein NRIC_34090 [Enterococcus florum]|uniref:Mga helix-turn-helix domain-containing protein n=1 Tax=Enterococcus florum TaxID=2480627 RepID=A0A4P5PGS6_9ENTE|nr:helix-turn-helix domain-containing protein [Enterococcus florum]GCF95518.1 hypothetical protein NRIC_34090 [Enterococcus florum]